MLKRYREPLAAAAYELQLRLHNILCKDFLGSCGTDHERRAKAEETTLFRLAQYFGWSEILRRDIEFLSPSKAPRTQKAVELKTRIGDCLSGSSGELGLTIWTDELMIVKEHDRVQCMGYARFHQEYAAHFAEWCDRLRAELTRSSRPIAAGLKDSRPPRPFLRGSAPLAFAENRQVLVLGAEVEVLDVDGVPSTKLSGGAKKGSRRTVR